MKNCLAVIGLLAIILFGLFIFADDESSSDEQEASEYYKDNDSDDSDDSENTEKEGINIEPGTNEVSGSSSSWGSGAVKQISASEFNKLVAKYNSSKGTYIGKGPAVVDFYATWCGPCQQLSPKMEKLAEKYKGKIQFYKIDIDKCGSSLTSAYKIESIPTLMFCSGSDIDITVGAPYDLESEVRKVLK